MREGSWGAHSGRSAAIWRLARAMAVFSIAVCLATVALFFVTQAWQYLGGTALAVASFAIAWHASRLVRREVEDAAAAWITAVPLVFVPLASLLWEGIALLLALLVVCLGVVLSTLGFPPKRRAVPWIASVLAGGVIWLTRSVVLPWERVNIGSNPLAGVMLWALVGAILVIVVWELTIAYRRLIAIRSRLLATFIAAVMVVALVVSVTSILLGISTAQQRVFDQLTTAVVLKAQATYTWLDRMRFSLESLIVEDYEVQRARPGVTEADDHLVSEAMKKHQDDLAQLCQTVNSLAGKLNDLHQQTVAQHRGDIARLAVEIARKILTHKVNQGEYDIPTIIEEALKRAPTRQNLVVRVNPEDLATCQKFQQENPGTQFAELDLVADWGIARADCLVETPKGIVKSFVEEHLSRIGEALEKAQ